MRGRRERRKRRRQRRREERGRRVVEEARRGEVGVVKEELVVVTWNVQGMSLRDASRRKLRMVAAVAERCRWDVVRQGRVGRCQMGWNRAS